MGAAILVGTTVSSGLTHLNRWVQAFELDAGVGGCKAPVGFGVMGVAFRHPRLDLDGKGTGIGDAAGEALAAEDGQS